MATRWALPARKLVWPALAVFAESDEVEHLLRLGEALRLRQAAAFQAECHVGDDPAPGEQAGVLEHQRHWRAAALARGEAHRSPRWGRRGR